MFEEPLPDDEFKTYCRVTSSFKCTDSGNGWADSYGIGDDCDEAQENMFEVCEDFCARAGQRDPIFRTIDWRCSCDRS